MDPLSIAGTVAGLVTLVIEASQTIVTYYKSVKDGPKSVEELTQELALMHSVLKQLDSFLRSQPLKTASFDHLSVLGSALSTCDNSIRSISSKLQTPKHNGIARALATFTWPFTEKETQKRLEALRRCTATFQFSLTVEGCNLLSRASETATSSLELQLYTAKKVLELTKDVGTLSASAAEASRVATQVVGILQLISTIHNTTGAIQTLDENVAALSLRSREEKEQQVLDWLSSTRYSKKHRDVGSRRLPGTGRWLLDCGIFKDWLNCAHPVLWCTGDPGAGKSVLTSLVIDEILEHELAGAAVAYFYFDFGEQKTQTPLYLVGSIVRQLALQAKVFPPPLLHFFTRFKENEAHGSTNELVIILRNICATFKKCYVIIDALDECQKDYRKEILKILNDLCTGKVQLFVTSRPHSQDIKQHFRGTEHIKVEAREADIKSYCLQLIDDHEEIEDLVNDELKFEIAETISKSAQGMFLLPVLQMRVIIEAMTRLEIRNSLRNLSANLGQAFSNSIQRIESEPRNRRAVALQALMWISHACRPLQIEELRHALGTQLGDRYFDIDNLLQPRFIIECCFGLVVIDDQSSVVRLVHCTLQDFLQSERRNLFLDEETEITRICLTYLCLDGLRTSDSELGGFLGYAAAHWGHHAKNASPERVDDLAVEFLTNTAKVSRAEGILIQHPRQRSELRWHRDVRVTRTGIGSGTTGLHVVAGLGIARLVRLLLDAGLNCDTQNDQGCTALHDAATNGHIETASLLLGRGSEVDSTNVDYNTPLFLAVSSAHEAMVYLLLKHGADPNKHCVDYWTALHTASDNGYIEIAKILITNKASVRAESHRGLIALHRAAGRGHLEILRLLLEDSPIDPTTKDGWTPLHGASSSGQYQAAKLLAERGANVNYQSTDGRTPLHRACRGGHYLTVAALLAKGADHLITDIGENIPLHRAAKGGHHKVAKLLLKHEPATISLQLTTENEHGRNAKGEAHYSGHWETAAILREEESPQQESESDTRSALDIAIEGGDLASITEILASGMNVNSLNADGVAPLHQALILGNKCLANILIDFGADFKVRTADGWEPLHCAAKKGIDSAVRLCLERGANIKASTNDGQTALHKVCKSGMAPTTRLLIESGADVEAADDWGWRPLHTASAAGFQDIVELLIASGANQEARDHQGFTVKACAARSGHPTLVEYLRMEKHKLKDKSRSSSFSSPSTSSSFRDGLDGTSL